MPHSALLIIDMQRGAFDGERYRPIDVADRLLGNVRHLLVTARDAKVPVVFVRHLEKDAGSPFEEKTAHAEIHPELMPRPDETVVEKRVCNGFENTDLNGVLERTGADEIVVCGLQSEFCIVTTIGAALGYGFPITLASDGHGTWDNEEGQKADDISAEINRQLGEKGVKLQSSSEIVKRWMSH